MNQVEAYIKHGWQLTVIAPGTKSPTDPGWHEMGRGLTNAALLPPGYGVGLMHAYSRTMALDIDDWERTKARGIDVDTLYADPNAVIIESGKVGHGKLLYRMPFGLVLPTKKFTDVVPSDVDPKRTKRINVYELRCGTSDGFTVQDVLPPSIHPDTGRPYQWKGGGHWKRLPMVPDQILAIWRDAIKDTPPPPVNGVDSSWDEIKEALSFIGADCTREDWIHVGMALKWAGESTLNLDQAFAVWNEWSETHPAKYPGLKAINKQWQSFKTPKGSLVTLGTLFHLARQAGWERKVPDASTLFADKASVAAPQDLFSTFRPEAPAIDLSLWPPVLATRAQEVSTVVGCDPVVPLFAGMAAACAVVDARSRLELMPGFKVPPILWLMTLGDPGDRKSPGSRPMLAPLRAIEADDKARYQRELASWEFKAAQFAASKTARLKFASSADALLAEVDAPPLLPEPPEPVKLKFTVSDVTSAKLVRLMSKRPQGMLCYLDEMAGWSARLTLPGSGEDRSAWVVGFEGDVYDMERQGDGSTHCENFALSFYGNMQPHVLERCFDALSQDGLLQRFLPAVPRHEMTRIGEPLPDWMTTAVKWENTLRLIHSLPTMNYRISPEAFNVYRTFQKWYEQRMKEERLIGSSTAFLTAFAKITGLAGRLAMMFHVLESPWEQVVNVDIIRRVIRITIDYIVPVLRYTLDDKGSSSTFDVWLMEHIIQYSDVDKLTISDIKRSARRQLEILNVKMGFAQTEYVTTAMTLLERMNWVVRVDNSKGDPEWIINPILKSAYADYRESIIQAKINKRQKSLDIIGYETRHNASDSIHGAKREPQP